MRGGGGGDPSLQLHITERSINIKREVILDLRSVVWTKERSCYGYDLIGHNCHDGSLIERFTAS
jgi:hypothetical protein